ncbi:hypothetical protein GF406_03065 [candidate division KSB1 bacterium]|nr:hypothetical protein [candidate division KSB1 bacterium]
MNEFNFLKTDKDLERRVGKQHMSWLYKPERSRKLLYTIFGIILALAAAIYWFGADLLPFLQKVPVYIVYALIFLAGPIANWVTKQGKDQEWTLYEKGYRLRIIDGSNIKSTEYGFYNDFDTVSYNEKGVKLKSNNPIQKSVLMRTRGNTMAVYMYVRERLGIEETEKMSKRTMRQFTPQSREHKKIREYEKRSKYDMHSK